MSNQNMQSKSTNTKDKATAQMSNLAKETATVKTSNLAKEKATVKANDGKGLAKAINDAHNTNRKTSNATKKRQLEQDESEETDKNKKKKKEPTKAKAAAGAEKRRKLTHNNNKGEQEQKEDDHEMDQGEEASDGGSEGDEEEEEEEASKDDKKNRKTKASKEDNTRHKTTVTVKTVKLVKKAKAVNLESKVKEVTRSPIQDTIDIIDQKINNATMGYALMNVMDDRDLGRGPTTVAQVINIRPIDVTFLKQFAADTQKQGLQNHHAANAIYIGVKRSWVVEESLEPLKIEKYANHVRWTDEAKSEDAKMLLYNGNHRRTYMRELGQGVVAYQQYQKARTELSEPKDATIRAVLEKVVEDAKKVLDEHGCWIVKFFDMDMINEPKYRSLMEHALASNTPLPTKLDTEDDKLAQILMILNRIRSAERPAYVKDLLQKMGLKSRKTKIPQILSHQPLYETIMTFTHIPHFRSSTTGTGLSCRQIGTWLKVTGGIQIYCADYMTGVLRFLSTPMSVSPLGKVSDHLKEQAAAKLVTLTEQHKSSFSMFTFVGKHYLEEWANIWFKFSSSIFDVFGADARDPEEKADRMRYSAAMDKYWRGIESHAEAMARVVTPEDRDAASMIRRFMPAKIEWLRSGLMFAAYPSTIRELPIPNKYLFAQLQDIFHRDAKNSVTIVSWVEPLAGLGVKQRNERMWMDHTSALEDHLVKRLQFTHEQVGTVYAFLMNRRCTTLRIIEACLLQLQKECKLNMKAEIKHLVEKHYVDFMTKLVNLYRAELLTWQADNKFDNTTAGSHEPQMRATPSEDVIDELANENLSAKQKRVAKQILYMLQVTAIDWVNTKQLKGIKQLIQEVSPRILRRSHTKEILASAAGWALREEMRMLLSVNMDATEWAWWDCFDARPKTGRSSNIPIDLEVMVTKMDGETAGNASARSLQVPHHREYNQGIMQKIINLSMDPRLGGINTYTDHSTTSPEMTKALKKFMEALVIESERHIARIEDPETDKSHASRSNFGDIDALLADYALVWPIEESKEGCAKFFGAIGSKQVQAMTDAALHEGESSKKMWLETKKRKEMEKKKIEKEQKALAKVPIFGPAARLARATKRMQELSLGEEAKRITQFDLENDVEMQNATTGDKSAPSESEAESNEDNEDESGDESGSEAESDEDNKDESEDQSESEAESDEDNEDESADQSQSEAEANDKDNEDESGDQSESEAEANDKDNNDKDKADMDVDQEGQVSKGKSGGETAADEESHYGTDPSMLEAMANIDPALLSSPVKPASVNTLHEDVDMDISSDDKEMEAGPSGEKLFLLSDNEESIIDWPTSDKEEDVIEDPPSVASSNASDAIDLTMSDDDCDTIDKAKELRLAQELQKKLQKTFYTWTSYRDAILANRVPNSCMEKVPALLRILCDLWRTAYTTKGKDYHMAVSAFILWLRDHSKQPSMVAMSEAFNLFPDKPIMQEYITVANSWKTSSVPMRGVMLQDMAKLYNGSLLKEFVDEKREGQKNGLQRE